MIIIYLGKWQPARVMAQVYIYYMCIITMQFFGSDWLLTRRSEYNEPLGSHCFRRMSHYSCVICIRSSDIFYIPRSVLVFLLAVLAIVDDVSGWPTRHKTFDGMRNSTLQCNVSKVTAHSFRTPSNLPYKAVLASSDGRTDRHQVPFSLPACEVYSFLLSIFTAGQKRAAAVL